MYSERAEYAATLLAASPPAARRDLYRVRAQPGVPRLSDPHTPGTTEHVVLGAGRATVGPVDQPVELGPGDYVSYPGDMPHIFSALEADTTAVMLIEYVLPRDQVGPGIRLAGCGTCRPSQSAATLALAQARARPMNKPVPQPAPSAAPPPAGPSSKPVVNASTPRPL